jgi:hypothetical protein
MKHQDTLLVFSPAPGRGLEPLAGAEHQGPARAHGIECFLAAIRYGGEMGHLARWRVGPTVGNEDEGTGQ